MNSRKAVKTLRRMGYAAAGALMLSYGASRLASCKGKSDFGKFQPKTEKMTASQRLVLEEKKVMEMPLQLGTPCVGDTAGKNTEITYVMKNRDTLYRMEWLGGMNFKFNSDKTLAKKRAGSHLQEKTDAAAEFIWALKRMENIPCQISPYLNWKTFFVSNAREFVIVEKPLELCPAGDSALAEAVYRSSQVRMNPWEIDDLSDYSPLTLEMALVHEAAHIYTFQKCKNRYGKMNTQDQERWAERFEIAYLYEDVKKTANEMGSDSEMARVFTCDPTPAMQNEFRAERHMDQNALISEAVAAKKNVLQNSLSYDKLTGKGNAEASRAAEVIGNLFAITSLLTIALIGIASIVLAFGGKKNGNGQG